jgi:squalene-hopene/tetraprenyl-beta-curcumene cyclase
VRPLLAGWLVLLVVTQGGGCRRSAPSPLLDRLDAALLRGGAALVARQGADGAIRSETYAAFRDGYSLTPLALAALFAMPDDRFAAPYARGVDYLATLVGEDGGPREDLDAPRYPLYAMSIAVLVLNVTGNDRHRGARDALVAALRRLQLGPDLGWGPDDLSTGGWSYHDGVPRRPEQPGEDVAASLSATVYAAGALALAGVPPDDPALALALTFVRRCRNADGGFFFSPALPDGNKAGPAEPPDRFRSYGSMTADGARALLRLGTPADHPEVIAAAAWLDRHFDVERNPGDFVPVNEVRRASSYYYWVWSAAHALRALGKPTVHGGELRWAEALAEALLARQRPDGTWANPASEMREDDPVVATSFAVAALGVCRAVLRGEHRSHAAAPR